MHNKCLNKSEKNVRLCKVRIEKKMWTKKNSKKKKLPCVHWSVQFPWGTFEITHAFSNSCLPFLDFFGHMMHFCKSPCATLIGTYCNFLQTFFSIILYWQALENAWPKQMPWKLSSKTTYHKL